jgi:hypothetical protein
MATTKRGGIHLDRELAACYNLRVSHITASWFRAQGPQTTI